MMAAPREASYFNSSLMIPGPGCHPPHPLYPAHTFKNKQIRLKKIKKNKKENENERGAGSEHQQQGPVTKNRNKIHTKK
jgi:hypothetical protein